MRSWKDGALGPAKDDDLGWTFARDSAFSGDFACLDMFDSWQAELLAHAISLRTTMEPIEERRVPKGNDRGRP